MNAAEQRDLRDDDSSPPAHAPLRIALAQVESRAADIPWNLEVALRALERAEAAGADLLVLPEMHLAGYFALDRFENPRFLAACARALETLAASTRGRHTAVAVGFPRLEPPGEGAHTKPFNSIALLENGAVVRCIDKRLLAGSATLPGRGDIFWDDRYFQSGRSIKTFTLKGCRIGVCICEDLFHPDHAENVPAQLLAEKPDLLIIPAVSPYNTGKLQTRLDLLQPLARQYRTPIFYLNAVGTCDGYEGEVAVDGRSIVLNRRGEIVQVGCAFAEDLLLCSSDPAAPPLTLQSDETAEIHGALVQGIRSYFRRNGASVAVIGSSGGIDSAVVTALAVEALGAENTITVTLPSHITSSSTLEDAQGLARNLGVRCDIRPIQSMYEAWLDGRTAAGLGSPGRLTKQNVQARIRLQILMEYTNETPGALLLNTTNKTEAFLGYGTLYADLAGAIAPLMDLNKLRVYVLAQYLNSRAGRDLIPASILARPPTAELEEGQTDEANLPAPYSILAPLVDRIVERQESPIDLTAWLTAEFNIAAKEAHRIVAATLTLIDGAEHKRRQVPPGERVTPKAAGAGRRMPLSRDAFNELTVYERLSEIERSLTPSRAR